MSLFLLNCGFNGSSFFCNQPLHEPGEVGYFLVHGMLCYTTSPELCHYNLLVITTSLLHLLFHPSPFSFCFSGYYPPSFFFFFFFSHRKSQGQVTRLGVTIQISISESKACSLLKSPTTALPFPFFPSEGRRSLPTVARESSAHCSRRKHMQVEEDRNILFVSLATFSHLP